MSYGTLLTVLACASFLSVGFITGLLIGLGAMDGEDD